MKDKAGLPSGLQCLLSLALAVGFWWADQPLELIAPWLREDWGHQSAWIYTSFLALLVGTAILLGFHIDDWKRANYSITFDFENNEVRTEEWFLGKLVEVSFDLTHFTGVAIHQHRDERWMLGVVLEYGSYWELLDGVDRQDLEPIAMKLENRLSQEKTEASPIDPGPFYVSHKEHNFQVLWSSRITPMKQFTFISANLLAAVAGAVPLLATFDGNMLLLLAALATSLGIWAVIELARPKPKGCIFLLAVWAAVALTTMIVLGANLVYFIIASLLLWQGGWQSAHVMRGLWSPPRLWIEIDMWGVISNNGDLLKDKDGPLRVESLEGSLTNVRYGGIPSLLLFTPGTRSQNLDRCMGRDIPDGEETDYASTLQYQLRIGSHKKRSHFHHPFCRRESDGDARSVTKNCHMIALGKWLGGRQIYGSFQVISLD